MRARFCWQGRFLLLLADPFAVDHVASSDQRFVFPCGYFYFNGSESRFPVPDPAPSPAAEYGAAQRTTCYKSKISSLFGENCQKERLCIDLLSSSFYNICDKKLGSILVVAYSAKFSSEFQREKTRNAEFLPRQCRISTKKPQCRTDKKSRSGAVHMHRSGAGNLFAFYSASK